MTKDCSREAASKKLYCTFLNATYVTRLQITHHTIYIIQHKGRKGEFDAIIILLRANIGNVSLTIRNVNLYSIYFILSIRQFFGEARQPPKEGFLTMFAICM